MISFEQSVDHRAILNRADNKPDNQRDIRHGDSN